MVAEEERVLNEKEIRDFYKDKADEVGMFHFLLIVFTIPLQSIYFEVLCNAKGYQS